MLILLTAIYNLALPYWDTLKKYLSKEDISSLTIIHSPNIFGHPIGIAILVLLGLFAIPTDPRFFIFWFSMILITSVALTLYIWGLVATKFFAVQIIGKLGFVTGSIGAVLLIGESLTFLQIVAIVLAVIGVICFSWPKKFSRSNVVIDKGIVFVVISIILTGVAAVFYKMSTFYVPDYSTFLSGRFVGDLIGWTFVWLIVNTFFLRRNSFKELACCVKNSSGIKMILGIAVSTLLSSWLIYELPLSTFAMLGVLTVPAAYFLGRFKYGEDVNLRMWVGTLLVIVSISLFLI